MRCKACDKPMWDRPYNESTIDEELCHECVGEALHIPKYKEVIPDNWDLYAGCYNAVDIDEEETYEFDE